MQAHFTNSQNYVEVLGIDIHSQESTYTVVAIYIDTQTREALQIFSDFLIETLFQELSNEANNVIIVGNININLLNMQNENTRDYIDNLIIHNYMPCITLPTKLTETTATLIDHIYLNIKLSDINDIFANI